MSSTDANGYSLLHSYDKYGKLVSVYDKFQLSYLAKRSYDAKGRLTKETDSHNTKYVYTYDGLDRITSIIVYDASGVVLTEQYIQYNTAVNQNGKGYTRLFVEQGAENERRNKVYLFDYLDRQVQETEQYGGEARSQYFEYDLAGNRISYTAKDGAVTKYAYDIFGNVTYALLPDGTENFFEYDYNGNCLSEVNGAGEEILYSYDGLNRLTRQETTNGEERSIHRNYYNFRNNLEVSLDAENNKTEYSYNLRGFLTDVRQYSNGTSGQETEYSYDGEGNISSFATGAIGDSNKHTYQYELDPLGRCIKETDPMGSIIQYAYETDGNLSQTIDKNGIVTNYTYDGLGRLIQESNSKGQNLSYTYNGFDEVTGITDGKLTVKNSYNKFGETVKITRDRNEENFTYDIAGRVTNHTISDLDIGTLTTRYTYDTLGRTTAIETDGGSEYISYDKAGRISEKNYPQTGVRKVYTYYKDSTLKSLLTYVDGKLTTTENIEYDRNGNKTLWEQDGKVTNYTYDGMNRLQGVKESNGVLTEYEFDSFGNISREYTLSSSGIKTTQYEYDRNNRLLISFDDKSSTRYSYDKNGNLINKIYELSGRETESWYSYDGYNRLSEYISGNTSAEYSYNPEGLRESKTVNGKYTRFIYDGANIVGELTDDNYYIYYRGTELLGMNSYDNNSYYYRLDSHGNVTDLLTHTGEALKTYTYNPYGKEKPFSINPAGNETILYHWKNETENTHNPFRYCGEYYDEESGLIYLRNRYYDPSIGRFISEDPIKDGLNWYVYCGGNPINYVDPWGLEMKMSQKDYDEFIIQARQIYGNSELDFIDQCEDINVVVLNEHSWVNFDYDGGSYLGRTLLKYVISTETTITFEYKDIPSASKGGVTGFDVNMYDWENPNYSYQERNAVLIHELTHIYTNDMGYDKIITDGFLGKNGREHTTLLRGYQEATAISVEEQFRFDMGYSPRSEATNAVLGNTSSDYGFWPHIVLNNPNDVLTQNISHSPLYRGLPTLKQSIYITYDIIEQFGE